MSTQKKAIWSLRIIMLVAGITQVTGALIAYIMASYADVSPTLVRSVLSIPSLGGLIVGFAVGPISMKLSKKKIIIACLCCDVVYFTLFTFFGTKGSITILLVAAAFAGFTKGAVVPMANALVGEFVTDSEKRGSCVAINTALMSGGFAVISMIAGAIASKNGGANWNQAYMVGIFTVIAIIVFAIMMPTKPDEEPSAQRHPQGAGAADAEHTKEKLPATFFAISVIAILFIMSYSTFSYNYSSFIITEYQLGTSMQASIASSALTVLGLFGGFTYKYWAKVLKKWTVPVAYGMIAVGLLLMVMIHSSIITVFIAAALCGLGQALSNPYIIAKIMEICPPKLVSLAMSWYSAFLNLAMFFALYVVTFFANFVGGGSQGAFIVGTIGAGISVIAAIFIYSITKKKTEQTV